MSHLDKYAQLSRQYSLEATLFATTVRSHIIMHLLDRTKFTRSIAHPDPLGSRMQINYNLFYLEF